MVWKGERMALIMATLFIAHHYNNQTSTPDDPQNQTPKPLPQIKEK